MPAQRSTRSVCVATVRTRTVAVEPALRTKEELAYYRVWREHLQGISAERTLSRFARA